METILSLLLGIIGIIGGIALKQLQKYLEQRHIGFLYGIAEKAVFYAEQWAINQIKHYGAEKVEGHKKLKTALEFIDRNFGDLDEKALQFIKDAIEAKLGEIRTIQAVKINA